MIQIEGIYQANYLHILSAIMDDLKLTQQMDRLVHSDPQCKTTPGEVVKLLVLHILSGRQPLVHLEKWAERQDLDMLI
ncbi:uncharacterized protein DUF4277 [Aneurinibacillus soli]|uniref:DUF4277 domain-containing protein n=1 Tax=Aneurinibacillus soli TaxID=1500254 RepID=A0A0U4NE87_9BACL|nr:uncharacterized protein DUF4277 [Aneurinibacillus soli]BAU27220.1 hypothetical protein CB4_01389 [Aneurinibacillus soli]